MALDVAGRTSKVGNVVAYLHYHCFDIDHAISNLQM
jgi:hypothetical protein